MRTINQQAKAPILCPECGAPMTLRETKKFTYPNGHPRKFYGCSTWPACDGIHGAHEDGQPLGIPADKETKAARVRAHALFDLLWKEKRMKRKLAYTWMRKTMGLTRDAAHIGMFDKTQCEQLVDHVRHYLNGKV